MLARAQQELLTRTGPGTLMGTLFRRYWIPALLAEELPEPDCPPVRVKLMSERLIAFRDSQGRLGLMDEFCAHRGVSLWFGRNEQSGLRCPYHGWKYDVTGQCVEVPSEPEESGFCKKITLKSYPLVERGGVLWTYMGPAQFKPELPAFEWATVAPAHRFVSKWLEQCNHLQAMEGGIDSSHVSFLHRFDVDKDPLHRDSKGPAYSIADPDPKLEVSESKSGLLIKSRRNADPGNYYWRITQWIMPWYTLIPPYGQHPITGNAWVPIDDASCWVFVIGYHPTRPLTAHEVTAMRAGEGIFVKNFDGSYRPRANRDNDYLMDRAAQKAGQTFSGVRGISAQDAAVQESMGTVQDRDKENLASTDNAIILARQRLMKAASDLQKGLAPPALDPETHKVRSASVVLPKDVAFEKGIKDALIARPDVIPSNV